MPTGLIRRGARYSIRRRIPVDLVGHYGGKAEVVRSLGTADPKEARRLLPLRWTELDEEWDAARAAIASAPAVKPQAERDDPTAWMSREQWDYMIESARVAEDDAMRDAFERDETEQAERELLALMDRPAEGLSIEQRALRALLKDSEGYRRSAEEGAKNAQGELKAVRRELADLTTSKASEEPSNGVRLDDVVGRWAAERSVKQKALLAHKAVVRDLIATVGDLPVSTIEKKNILAFKDQLIANGETPANINAKLSRLRTLFNYARFNDLVTRNPTDDIKVIGKPSAQRKRREWTAEALNQLFAGPVHVAGDRPLAGGGEAAYWLPLLALFTGARQTELGQLHPSDVRQEAYTDQDGKEQSAWVVQLVANEERGQRVKTEGSERRVPLHPALIQLGFLAFVSEANGQGRSRIFHDIKSGAKEELMGRWSKWFTRYRRAVGVAAADMPFHAFRHSFKHYARLCGVRKEISDEITGHATGDVGDDYGGLSYPLAPLVEGMALYRVPGLKLPPPPR